MRYAHFPIIHAGRRRVYRRKGNRRYSNAEIDHSVRGQASHGTINASDRRLKKDIETLPLGRAFLQDLEPVRFRWKATKGEDKIEMGLIAQDAVAAMQKHGVDYTEYGFVHHNEDDYYRLNYTQLVAPLINAVKELSEENTALKDEVATLKAQMATVLARLG